MIAIPFENLIGASRQGGELGIEQSEGVAQPDAPPAFRQRPAFRDLNGIAVPAVVSPQVLRPFAAQPVLDEMYSAGKARRGIVAADEEVGFAEGEPQRGLAPFVRRFMVRNVKRCHSAASKRGA